MKILGPALALLLLLPDAFLFACCAVCRVGFNGAVQEKEKSALIFVDAKDVHWVLEMSVGAGKALPKELAWVIPVPSVPRSYAVADPAIFAELKAVVPPPPGSYAVARYGGPVAAGVVVHETKIVGDYEIVPLEIANEDSDAELNGWLAAHGFVTFPKARLAPYLKKGAAFLAVRVRRLANVDEAKLKPLHLAYRRPADGRVSLPLRFLLHGPQASIEMYLAHSGHAIGLAPNGVQLPPNTGGELTEGSRAPKLRRLVGERNSRIDLYRAGGEPATDPVFDFGRS